MLNQKEEIPSMGKHLVLDFQAIQNFDVNSYELVNGLFSKILKELNFEVISQQYKQFEPQGLTIIYLLKLGHFTIHTWPESQACAIDFYQWEIKNWSTIKKIEEMLCDALGWYSATTTVTVPRGSTRKLHTNETNTRSEILHGVKLLHRERTKFQDLRVYDTSHMGRIMTLDGMVQISNELEDNYTVDMSKEIVKAEIDYEHIVIIGGGDMLIAKYLLERFPKIKKITNCEIDKRVTDITREFFEIIGKSVQDGIDSERLELIFNDGAIYAKELKEMVDGIIIDCTDCWIEGGVAQSLFTADFYKAIAGILKKGASFSQQLSFPALIPSYQEKWKEAGFTKVRTIDSLTPEYGQNLPLGIVTQE